MTIVPSLKKQDAVSLAKKFADPHTANFYKIILESFISYQKKSHDPNWIEFKYSLLENLEDFIDETYVYLRGNP